MEEFDFVSESWMDEIVDSFSGLYLNDPALDYGVHRFSFEKLIVWNKSIELVEWIYIALASFPMEEKFNLTSQIRRSAISIPSNIAEGSGRTSSKERIHFLNIAYSSSVELLNQLIIAFRLNFLTPNQYAEARIKIQEITAMLFALKKTWANN